MERYADKIGRHAEPARVAERRQIIRRGTDVEPPTRERPLQQTRSMFDGLRLEKSPLTRDASPTRSEQVRTAEPHADLPQAVTRHGRIVQAIRFAQSVGDRSSPEQKAELAASRAALDRIQPHGARDLESAMAVDQRLIVEAGAGRTNAVIRAMQLEAEMRTDPQLRADTFVQRWQGLERQRRLLLRDHEDSRADRVAQTMAGMAKGLERDPQVDSILRSRRAQLGLPEAPSRSVAESLGELVSRTRSRGLGIGM